jgi:hypothetical protein
MNIRMWSFVWMLAAGLIAGRAEATTLTTTSFATWQTEITGAFTDVSFVPISNSNYNTASGIALSGFTITGPNNGGYSLTGSIGAGPSALFGSANAGAGINVATPVDGKNAIFLSVGTSGGTPITLALSDGQSFTVNTSLFGFTLSHDITSFLLTTSPGSQVYINDLAYGASSLTQDVGDTPPPDTSATPEGATVALIGGGLLVLFGSRKKWASGLFA